MASADEHKLLTASGYYATESGKDEVERGLHDETLRKNAVTREDWLVKWNLQSISSLKRAD